MTATVGKVHTLQPDDPMPLPPCVTYRQEPTPWYDHAAACAAVINREETPVPQDWLPAVSGFWCTRPHHDDAEIHVCHVRDERTGKPLFNVVWGGE